MISTRLALLVLALGFAAVAHAGDPDPAFEKMHGEIEALFEGFEGEAMVYTGDARLGTMVTHNSACKYRFPSLGLIGLPLGFEVWERGVDGPLDIAKPVKVERWHRTSADKDMPDTLTLKRAVSLAASGNQTAIAALTEHVGIKELQAAFEKKHLSQTRLPRKLSGATETDFTTNADNVGMVLMRALRSQTRSKDALPTYLDLVGASKGALLSAAPQGVGAASVSVAANGHFYEAIAYRNGAELAIVALVKAEPRAAKRFMAGVSKAIGKFLASRKL